MQQDMVPNYMQLLQVLQPVCSQSCAVSGATDAGGADIDNAVSAVVNMLKISPTSLPLAETLTMILNALPLKADFGEAENVYGCICDILDSAHPAALGLLPQILTIFAKSLALSVSKVNQDVKSRIILSTYRLSVSASAPIFMSAAQSLHADLQAVLQQALQYAASNMPPPPAP
jgi:hypothetical protein